MVDAGDMVGGLIGIGFELVALNALNKIGEREEERPKQKTHKNVKLKSNDFWEETFG